MNKMYFTRIKKILESRLLVSRQIYNMSNVKDTKVAETQKRKSKVKCDQAELKNVAVFKYLILVSLFYADG